MTTAQLIVCHFIFQHFTAFKPVGFDLPETVLNITHIQRNSSQFYGAAVTVTVVGLVVRVSPVIVAKP